jgi:O-antigen chain-terminating methyltransferase
MPLQPPTLRGKIGAFLVRLVARALFWYTPQINEAVIRIAELLREHATRITEISEASAGWRAVESELRSVVMKADHLEAANAHLRHELEAALQTIRILEQDRDPGHNTQESRQPVGEISTKIKGLTTDLEAIRAAGHQLRDRLNELADRQRNTDLYTHQTRAMLSSQQSRLVILAERQRRNGANVQEPPPAASGCITGLDLGPLYLEFENAFRGSRGEIKERVKVYLPYLVENKIGSSRTPVLDLGCGRGEWLEVLAENAMVAEGVEAHASFVEECRGRGLTVHHADALEFLRNTLPESQGGVTAFHVLEHLPFSMILGLLDEACRVLKPGGLLTVEMPNPANLLVGAHSFYMDPSHIRPLPSDLMRFVVESRGFIQVEAVLLHPFPECYRLDETDNRAAAVLNQFLFGPQDYAIIARRP